VVDDSVRELFDAQIATAKITCIVTGGVLGVLTAGMLAFYIKLFIDEQSKRLGMLKALGYSNAALALRFWVFGSSVLIGAAAGYAAGTAAMPYIYGEMTIEGMPSVAVQFHVELLFLLVVAPPAVFGALACAYAAIALRKSPTELLRGSRRNSEKADRKVKVSDKPFLYEMCGATLRGKKSAVFFVTFACFCFSAMVQMGASMFDFGGVPMSTMILTIGVVLAVTALIMAVTTVVNGNKRNIAVMKAFGYTRSECASALLAGYVPFALTGFAVGTVYQYGFLIVMINVVFKDVENVPTYCFDVPVFFITLGAFIACYVAAMLFYAHRISKISVKHAMSDE
ncbi:MAG: ABC transporter permease, partial [Clostridiales bacterium]|nr:ABC transporter permease [Clostridiales bacterium]